MYSSTIAIPPISTPPNPSTQSNTKVILVRNARTNYNEQGIYQGCGDESVLTEIGYASAYQTGLALQQFSFDAIYTSPLTRVQQTTQAILSTLKQTTDNLPPVLIDRKLTEINMSVWQGLSYQEVKEKFPKVYNSWQETPHLFTLDRTLFPVVELFQQAQQFWQEILNKHRGQTILVVAHGGTNRALISTAIGLNPAHYHSLQQSNCGISCLEFPSNHSNYGKLNYLNVTNHLGENLPKLKAGKRGLRWLLLSDTATENFLKSACLPEFIHQNSINLILTDDSQRSSSLAMDMLENSTKAVHLPIAQENFLEIWQQTIFARQRLKSSVEEILVTGLIIVPENLLCQILQKTLGITIPLETTNHLSVIHYPQDNRQSIVQGLLPINQNLVTQLS